MSWSIFRRKPDPDLIGAGRLPVRRRKCDQRKEFWSALGSSFNRNALQCRGCVAGAVNDVPKRS